MIGDSGVCQLEALVLFVGLVQLVEMSLFGDCEHVHIEFVQLSLRLFYLENSFFHGAILDLHPSGSSLANQLIGNLKQV